MVNEKLISKGKQREFYGKFMDFFEEEVGEEIGIIMAEKFLDFFVDEIGAQLYDSGVEDAKRTLISKFEEFEYVLEEIKKGG